MPTTSIAGQLAHQKQSFNGRSNIFSPAVWNRIDYETVIPIIQTDELHFLHPTKDDCLTPFSFLLLLIVCMEQSIFVFKKGKYKVARMKPYEYIKSKEHNRMPVNNDSPSDQNLEDKSGIFSVVVTMIIMDDAGKEVDSKKIDFGKLRRDQVKGLADLFSMMSSNMEYIKKLQPQYEKLDKSKPPYLQ
jgi:hypothetical protein